MLFFALVSADRAVDIFQASPVMLEDLWRFIQAHVQVEQRRSAVSHLSAFQVFGG